MSESPFITHSKIDSVDVVQIESSKASCKISLHGAHVLSFIPKKDNRERLWLSSRAIFNGKKAIRGGIPLCWPWFSDDHGQPKGTLPSHGFLRTQQWEIQSTEETNSSLIVTLVPSILNADGFSYKTSVLLKVEVGDTLTVSLHTTNLDSISFSFNAALHTYFNVENIEDTQLIGLSGDYKDKLNQWAVSPTPEAYTFKEETDRIHLSAPQNVAILQNTEVKTEVNMDGHDSVVVWNPWQGSETMADMPNEGYKTMLCVEAAITTGCEIKPGQTKVLTQKIY